MRWRVRLGREAERGFAAILAWTATTFGRQQADTYRNTVKAALQALATAPDIQGSKTRDDIGSGIRTLHVALNGRRGRHVVVYRATVDRQIDVLRILHDSMDVATSAWHTPDIDTE